MCGERSWEELGGDGGVGGVGKSWVQGDLVTVIIPPPESTPYFPTLATTHTSFTFHLSLHPTPTPLLPPPFHVRINFPYIFHLAPPPHLPTTLTSHQTNYTTTQPPRHPTSLPPHLPTSPPPHHPTIPSNKPSHHLTTPSPRNPTTPPPRHPTTLPPRHSATRHPTTPPPHHLTTAPPHHPFTSPPRHNTTAPPPHLSIPLFRTPIFLRGFTNLELIESFKSFEGQQKIQTYKVT